METLEDGSMVRQGTDRKGRKVYFGTAPSGLVHKKYGKVKTYQEALDSLRFMMYQYHVGIMHRDTKTMRVDRKVYGKRKIV